MQNSVGRMEKQKRRGGRGYIEKEASGPWPAVGQWHG